MTDADKILRELLVALADADLVASDSHYALLRERIMDGEKVHIRRSDRESRDRREA